MNDKNHVINHLKFESLFNIQEKLDSLDKVSLFFFKTALIQKHQPNSKELDELFLNMIKSYIFKWRYFGPFSYLCLLFNREFDKHVFDYCSNFIHERKNRWLLDKCSLSSLQSQEMNARQHHFQWLEAKLTSNFLQQIPNAESWFQIKFLQIRKEVVLTTAKKNSHLISFWLMVTIIFLFSVVYAMVSGSFTLNQFIRAWLGLIA